MVFATNQLILNMKLLFIAIGLILSISIMQAQQEEKIVYEPIGAFHTSYNKSTGAPRQGRFKPEGEGIIELLPKYHEALQGLENYKYILVFYHLHLVNSWDHMVTPPGSKKEFGLFATRTPRRPNPIGFSVIKLESIENGVLHVSGVDAYDETPVIDIKPYIPIIDCVENQRDVKTEKELGITKTNPSL